jgi:p-aminobenzoyl-glutamate transporter AbgT
VEKVGQFTTVMQETIIKFIAIVITIVIMVISTTMVKVSIQETRSRNHYSFKKLFNKKI